MSAPAMRTASIAFACLLTAAMACAQVVGDVAVSGMRQSDHAPVIALYKRDGTFVRFIAESDQYYGSLNATRPGRLYAGGTQIDVYDFSGALVQTLATDGERIEGMSFDRAGRLYATALNPYLFIFDADGVRIAKIALPPGFGGTSDLAADQCRLIVQRWEHISSFDVCTQSVPPFMNPWIGAVPVTGIRILPSGAFFAGASALGSQMMRVDPAIEEIAVYGYQPAALSLSADATSLWMVEDSRVFEMRLINGAEVVSFPVPLSVFSIAAVGELRAGQAVPVPRVPALSAWGAAALVAMLAIAASFALR